MDWQSNWVDHLEDVQYEENKNVVESLAAVGKYGCKPIDSQPFVSNQY